MLLYFMLNWSIEGDVTLKFNGEMGVYI